jgi:hypothetical protein
MNYQPYTIFSLPRTGSTNLARLLSLHPDGSCLIEPFHPRRYSGQYASVAQDWQGLIECLQLISYRWRGIKHVCEADGFPFRDPSFNLDMLRISGRKTIFLKRNNLLQRAVSNWISRHTHFWMGSVDQFRDHFTRTKLPTISLDEIRRQVMADQRFNSECVQILASREIDSYVVVSYEELFERGALPRDLLQRIFTFLSLEVGEASNLWSEGSKLFDFPSNRYATPEIYRAIPGIEEVEAALAGPDNGRLFTSSGLEETSVL